MKLYVIYRFNAYMVLLFMFFLFISAYFLTISVRLWYTHVCKVLKTNFYSGGGVGRMAEIILRVLEIVGTIAFAVTGAGVSIKADLDLFGVVFVGCISAVGGGIMRDLLLGITPPAIFSNLLILGIAALAALVTFLFAYFAHKKFDAMKSRLEALNNICDAFGLAAFAVMGTEIGFVHGVSYNALLTVTSGLLTAVGGGMLRDVLTASTPYIFKKHVYALTALAGGILYYVLRLHIRDTLFPSLLAMALIVFLRLLATKYRWSLPKVRRIANAEELATPQENAAENDPDGKRAA